MNELYKEILECIDKPKYKEIDIKNFLVKVCSLAQNIYKVKANINFEKLTSNSRGTANYNNITINTRHMKLRSLHEITNTIFHETRHVYQHLTIKKDLNGSFPPQIPAMSICTAVYLIKESRVNINPYYLYYTSQNEKDARDSARQECQKLFLYIYSNVKTPKIKKLFKIYLKKIASNNSFEDDLYAEYLSYLPRNIEYVKEKVIPMISETLSITQKAFEDLDNDNCSLANDAKKYISYFTPTISAYVNLYCDDFIKNQVIEFCMLHKNIKELLNAMLTTFNSYYCKLDKNDWILLFSLYDNNYISKEQIQETMKNYRMEEIEKLYQNYKNNQKNNHIIDKFDIIKQISFK